MPVPNDPHGFFAGNPPTNNGLEHGQAYNTHDGNKPNDDPSTIGEQLVTEYIEKRALVDAVKRMVFTPLSTTKHMPLHRGKKMKGFVYVPLLDDANVNDQGIDAQGLRSTVEFTITISAGSGSTGTGYINSNHYVVGEGADEAAAKANAEAKAVSLFKQLNVFDTDYATTVAALTAAGWQIDDMAVAVPVSGNLYGSSTDIGNIQRRLPLVGEHGGRVNRIGHSRKTIEGSMHRMGFYDEITADSVNFDSDPNVRQRTTTSMLQGAVEIYEAALQIDIINTAGIVMYGGNATTDAEMTGEVGAVHSIISYTDLTKMTIMLNKNRTPTSTPIITGSRLIDTKVIDSARILYIGSALIPVFENMTNSFGKQAMIPREHYADAATLITGEIGTIYHTRIVVVPEMLSWEGEGADVIDNAGFMETDGKYDIHPALIVGAGSFSTIGFQTGGKGNKFEVIHKPPGKDIADRHNPYGLVGFNSINFWYGFMPLRPERIGLHKSVAPY